MKLILLRHCEPISETKNVNANAIADDENSLSEFGRGNAVEIAKSLEKGFGSFSVIASPMTRARETAEVLARQIGTTVEYDERLKERYFAYDKETTILEGMKLQVESYMNPDGRTAKGESIRDHRNRTESWWSDLTNNFENYSDTLVVVSHGGTIEHITGLLVHSEVESMAYHFMNIECGKYNLWTKCDMGPKRQVWRLDRFNRGCPE